VSFDDARFDRVTTNVQLECSATKRKRQGHSTHTWQKVWLDEQGVRFVWIRMNACHTEDDGLPQAAHRGGMNASSGVAHGVSKVDVGGLFEVLGSNIDET
jgi:hypothetical protein